MDRKYKVSGYVKLAKLWERFKGGQELSPATRPCMVAGRAAVR